MTPHYHGNVVSCDTLTIIPHLSIIIMVRVLFDSISGTGKKTTLYHQLHSIAGLDRSPFVLNSDDFIRRILA